MFLCVLRGKEQSLIFKIGKDENINKTGKRRHGDFIRSKTRPLFQRSTITLEKGQTLFFTVNIKLIP